MAVTVTAVASVTTANGIQLLAASARSKFIVENSDANRLYVLLGSGNASTSLYSFSLATNESAEIVGYSGLVKGIWAGDGSGHAMLSEFS